MRNIFQRSPFLRITLAFMSGISLSPCLHIPQPAFFIYFGITIIIFIVFNRYKTYQAVRYINYLLSLAIIVSGIYYASESYSPPEKHLGKNYYLAELYETPTPKHRTYSALIQLSNPELGINQKAICYFSKKNYDSTLLVGDRLIILTQPRLIKNAGNPYEFDYQGMMRRKGICYSIYLNRDDYVKTGSHFFKLKHLAETIRDKLLHILGASGLKGEELAVVSALTLGYKKELDPETRTYFSSAGAMHVLAVSGLHVGLIYLILAYLLSFLKRTRNGLLTFTLAVIFLLWAYAFLTGLSPSVMRATIMFSFILMGENIRRSTNIFNTLAASAFLLMLINPKIIYEPGFQLSYLAVIGIVIIQPAITKLIDFKHPVLHKIGLLTAVSIAAQISTFPLSLYYFNQFPNLFWLSNLFVVPLSGITIVLTLCYFILSPITQVAKLIGTGIHWLIRLMLFLLKWIDSIDWAVTKGITLSHSQLWMLYLLISLFILFFFLKKRTLLITALLVFVAFQSSKLYSNIRLMNQKKIMVYNTKHLLIHLIDGRNNYIITRQKELLSEREIRIIENHRQHFQLNEPITIDVDLIKNYHSRDLLINDHIIQFLSCTMQLNDSEMKISKSPNNQTITNNMDNSEKNIRWTKTIAWKNSYPKGKSVDESIHYTRIEGAYITDIQSIATIKRQN